ncbi:MAG: hypothetical protein K0R50_2190 [Eubacterium sp.]|jgi:hypothetical protein|nr:hypothetical protein [Eubacterium sp.]
MLVCRNRWFNASFGFRPVYGRKPFVFSTSDLPIVFKEVMGMIDGDISDISDISNFGSILKSFFRRSFYAKKRAKT